MKRFGVEVLNGKGEICKAPTGTVPGIVKVSSDSGKVQEYACASILVSTGSIPAIPPIPGTKDNPQVVDSTKLLAISQVPKRLAVIGGGVIGVEFAGLFSSLNAEVSVIEMMDEIVPFMDKEQAPLLRRAMHNVNFKLGCKVERIEGATVYYTNKEGKQEKTEADLVLVAVGRRPVINTWGAETLGIDCTPKGLTVDDRMRTSIPGIWAAGDVTGRSLLAHSAYRMAEVAVADIQRYLNGTGDTGNRMRYQAVPWAVYGITESAGVGITEQDALAKGIAICKASLPMRVSGRFAAEHTFAGHGAVKVIADAGTRKILGVHAVGAYSSEFIWGGAALIEQELCIEDVKQLIFPHPTVCELIRDAVWEL
jgi:dihydrolipoamide dehydrogenase